MSNFGVRFGRGLLTTPSLLVGGTIIRWLGLPFESLDAVNFVRPWYLVLQAGGTNALATDFSNYNPPYLYLLWLAGKFAYHLEPLVAVKLLGAIIDVALCSAVAALVTLLGRAESRNRLSFPRTFSVTWCLPTVWLNSAFWAQCDALHTMFVVTALALLVSRRPRLGSLCLGLGIATKLQAAFVAPAFLAIAVMGAIPVSTAPFAAVGYLLAVVPVIIIGRDWVEALTVYLRQASTFQVLAAAAPNLWTIVPEKRITHEQYLFGVYLGLSLAGSWCVAFLSRVRKLSPLASAKFLIEIAFTCAFVLPFLLPKMHDRYFFMADVLSLVLACIDRKWVRTAILVQVGSISAYSVFLLSVWQPLMLGILTNSLVFVLLVFRWWPSLLSVAPRWTRALVGSLAD